MNATRELVPLSAHSAQWIDGFWGGVVRRTYEVTNPSMWRMLDDPAVSPGLTNFRIAAGLEEGEHVGPPFMDGDTYKWFEAMVAQLEAQPDADLAARLEQIAALIASVQREDGYLHTPTAIDQRYGRPVTALADRFNFETYNLGHLITAAVRHHAVTGSRTLLAAAIRAAGFLQSLATERPDELARSAICPSHYMAVIELYRATSDPQYLRLAETFLRVRDEFDEGGDDNQDRLAVRDQTVAAGHAVRANYLYAGLADLVAETGDEDLLGVLDGLWRDVVDTKISVIGGCGALYDGASPDGSPWQDQISRVHQAYGRAYQLPHTTAHNESCANIGMIFWSERMLALTGEARFADVIETIAYNALLAGIGLGGDDYFYTNPLRQVRGLPYPLRRAGDTGLQEIPEPPASHERTRQHYLSCFCCPPNIARLLSRFHERAASVGADGLYVHQYGGSRVAAETDAGNVRLREQSNYPWEGRIAFTVEQATGTTSIHLRIPRWCRDATLTVNGRDQPVPDGGYARLERAWQVGDLIVLDLAMPVRLVRAHRLAEEATNQVAIQRGPLVYCLETPDLPEGITIERAAIRRGTPLAPRATQIAGQELVALETELVVLPEAGDDLYEDIGMAQTGTVSARLIPYFAWSNRGPSEMSVWLPVVW